MEQYKLSKSELNSRTLWLSVWDWDRFGRNQFLGEVYIPLASLDLTMSGSEWYSLQEKVLEVLYSILEEIIYQHQLTRIVCIC